MSQFLDDAGEFLRTAIASEKNASCNIAILVGPRGNLTIVDAEGWDIAALQHAHCATKAYTVRRTPSSVTVEGRSGCEQVALRRTLRKSDPLIAGQGVPRHLLYPGPALLPAK